MLLDIICMIYIKILLQSKQKANLYVKVSFYSLIHHSQVSTSEKSRQKTFQWLSIEFIFLRRDTGTKGGLRVIICTHHCCTDCQSSAVAVVSEVKGMPLTATETHEMHPGRRCNPDRFHISGSELRSTGDISGKAYAARNFPVA